MSNVRDFYGTPEVADQIGINLKALQMWLSRNPDFRPMRRFSGDDLLWTPEEIERVKNARQRTKKHGNRKEKQAI